MDSLSDTFRLNNGIDIPCIGFGTWKVAEGEMAYDAVRHALEAGYRHIDTAAVYGNEKSVGRAVADSGLDRQEIFVTTKLWNTERGYETTLRAFDESMNKLALDYIDLYLIHWPDNKADGVRVNSETWRAFEKLYKERRIKAIGVSNFLTHHLEPLMERAEIMPMVNQIEYHPGQMQSETVAFCERNGILIEAWGPLGHGRMLENAELKAIAARHGKSAAQLCIRWCLQNKVLPLPKSIHTSRMIENSDVFDFRFTDEEMNIINQIPYFGGSGHNPDTVAF